MRIPVLRPALHLLPLRLIVGYGFAAHGLAKLLRGPDGFAVILAAIGIPAPHLMAWLTTGVELVGGLALMAGILVPLVAIPLAGVILTALVTVHLPYGYSSIRLLSVGPSGATFGPVGIELDLLYLIALLVLALGGPTIWSFDAWHARRRPAAG